MIRIGSIKIKNSGFENYSENKEKRRKQIADKLKSKAAAMLKISAGDIDKIIIKKHSVDARKKTEIFDLYTVDIGIGNLKTSEEKLIKKAGLKNASVVKNTYYKFPAGRKSDNNFKRNVKHAMRPVIVGAGPAGLFCAYELSLSGYCPIVLERGMEVDKRSAAVEQFWNGGELNEIGNVQFGEGGAGTFSDGKLNTMVKDKSGRNTRSLEIFVLNGAPQEILYESKPHIGTDVLKKVIKNIRNSIIEKGGEFHFETKVTDIITESGNYECLSEKSSNYIKGKKIIGVRCESGIEFYSEVVVLAIGHSARDTFYMLNDKGVKMQQKPFAVGLRVEHPQTLINEAQYGIKEPKTLPPSPYKVTSQSPSGHGVYSFCMCPGGYVVNASSEPGRLCINGMSYSGRDGKNANSAIIVTVDTKDFGSSDVLAGVEFQRRLEEKAYTVGKGCIPVEYYDDYKNGIRLLEEGEDDSEVKKHITEHEHSGRNTPSMKGAYSFGAVHSILPIELGKAVVSGMEHFGHLINGFNSDDALLSGVESRTSSPVRITRDEFFEAEDIMGFYPCGEGAGYAGGITSAAIDGIKVAEQIAIHYYTGKQFFRRQMERRRKEISGIEKTNMDNKILNNISGIKEFDEAENILIYFSIDDEANTVAIIRKAISLGKNVYCPRIINKSEHKMEFIKIGKPEDMTEGSYGIPEPLLNEKSEIYDKALPNTLMILPGLCFDRNGRRIGYGGGYYDRYMKRFFTAAENGMIKCAAIGYNFQVCHENIGEYTDSNDMAVGLIITDEEIIRV